MSNSNKYYVYCLFRPWNLSPCYIGKGCGKRNKKHKFFGDRHYNLHLANIFKRAGDTEIPCVIIHQGLDEETAFEYEKAFIAAIGRSDLGLGSLCNHSDGGEGNSNPSAETRAKMSAFATQRKHSEETRAKISAIGLGKKRSAETRERMSKGRQKYLAENPHSMTGRKHSEETKAKIAAKNRGKIVSDETRERMRATKRNMSDETRRRMSQSAKLRCARRNLTLTLITG